MKLNKIRLRQFSWISFAILLAISLYIFLCLVHFVRGRPLWNDEYCVFQSIEVFQPHDFFSRILQSEQVFPRVYLLVIQKMAQQFCLSVWGLRLLPFVSMMLAFAVWLWIARRELKESLPFLMFCLCWTASVPLVYYAAELKPYSMDVLAGGLFTLFLLRQAAWAKNLKPAHYLSLLAALPFLGLFSYPAIFMTALPLANLVLIPQESRRRNRAIAVYMGMVLMVASFVYCCDVRLTQVHRFQGIWNDYFVSIQSLGEFFKTFGEGTVNLFSRWFLEQPRFWKSVALCFTSLAMIYIPTAFVWSWRKFKRKSWQIDSLEKIAFLLYLELFLLGILKKYPFSVPRLSLFYSPLVLLMTIKAIGALKDLHPGVGRIVLTAFSLFLLVASAGITVAVLTGPLGAIHPIWGSR